MRAYRGRLLLIILVLIAKFIGSKCALTCYDDPRYMVCLSLAVPEKYVDDVFKYNFLFVQNNTFTPVMSFCIRWGRIARTKRMNQKINFQLLLLSLVILVFQLGHTLEKISCQSK